MNDGGRGRGRLERIAWAQYGLVTGEDARRCGLSRAALRWRLDTGQLHRLYPSVYRFAGAQETWEQRAMGVLLWLGPSAALSHGSAAFLLRLDGFEHRPQRIDVLVPWGVVSAVHARRHAVPRRVEVHRTRDSFGSVMTGRLRATDPTRTLLDLSGVVSPARGLEDRLDDALDSAQRKWPGAARRLERVLERHSAGRRGAGRLGQLLAERGGDCTDSPLEARVFRALRSAGVRRPVPQHEVFDAAGYVVRVDFAWPEERVALHVDGYGYHQQRSRFERDRTVANRLVALGWASVSVTHDSLKDRPWLTTLLKTLEERSPQFSLGLVDRENPRVAPRGSTPSAVR